MAGTANKTKSKPTGAAAIDPDGVKLTPQQEAFAHALATGKSQSDAYKEAYPTSVAWKDGSVYSKSSQLAANAKIMQRVHDLRVPVVERLGMTIEGHLQKLKELRDKAEQADEFTSAIKAEELRGKVAGFYVSRTEDVTDPIKKALGNMKPSDAEAMINALDQVAAIRANAKNAA